MLENNRQNYEGKEYCNVYKNNLGKVLFKGIEGGLMATNEKNLVNLENMQ